MVKKLISIFIAAIILISPNSLLFSQEKELDISKITNMAEDDAERDANNSSTSSWLVGAAGMSIILNPLLGGLGTVLYAGSSGGYIRTPIKYTMKIEKEYGKNFDAIRLYTETYEEHYKQVRRNNQKGAAWRGIGIGFLFYLVVFNAIMSDANSSY